MVQTSRPVCCYQPELVPSASRLLTVCSRVSVGASQGRAHVQAGRLFFNTHGSVSAFELPQVCMSGIPVVKTDHWKESVHFAESEHARMDFGVVSSLQTRRVQCSLQKASSAVCFFLLLGVRAAVYSKCNFMRFLFRFFNSRQRWTAARSIGGRGRRSLYASQQRSCR